MWQPGKLDKLLQLQPLLQHIKSHNFPSLPHGRFGFSSIV